MKILSAEQIRAADAYTLEHESIKSIDLMERAALACVEWITYHFSEETKVIAICGMGNNGGDGLAISRLLHDKGHNVEVYIAPYFSKASDDFSANRKKLEDIKGIKVVEISKAEEITISNEPTIIIDAILGSGLSKPVEGKVAELIQHINSLKCPIVAIDISSGLMMEDNSKLDRKNIINATATLTFEAPKLAFMFADNAQHVGDLYILNIGIDKQFLSEQKSLNHYITREKIAATIHPRPKFSHKGNYGHALLIAGSYGKMGAAVLAGKSCLRAGVGLLTMHIPKCGYWIVQVSVPEAMASVDDEVEFFSGVKDISMFNAIGIGPGIGTDESTEQGLKLLLQQVNAPIVLDADALNILAENRTWLSFLPAGSILTPHPGEFARLAGRPANSYEAYVMQKEFAVKHAVYLILKGAYTSIATPDGEVYFNSTGNPGMATGGSGDTLTGIITSLLAQGYSKKQAAIVGVYLHGLAGDIAANEMGENSLIAEDITNCLGKAYKELAS